MHSLTVGYTLMSCENDCFGLRQTPDYNLCYRLYRHLDFVFGSCQVRGCLMSDLTKVQ